MQDVDKLDSKKAIAKYGTEVFRLLCGLTTGEANAVVRGGERTKGVPCAEDAKQQV